MLIVFDDVIANVVSNKKLNPATCKLFITGRKLTILLVFITQSCFKVPKFNIFIMKIPNKRELQQITINHSSEICFKDL